MINWIINILGIGMAAGCFYLAYKLVISSLSTKTSHMR